MRRLSQHWTLEIQYLPEILHSLTTGKDVFTESDRVNYMSIMANVSVHATFAVRPFLHKIPTIVRAEQLCSYMSGEIKDQMDVTARLLRFLRMWVDEFKYEDTASDSAIR